MIVLPTQAVELIAGQLANILLDNVGNKITEALLNGVLAVFKANVAGLELDLPTPVVRLQGFPSGSLVPPLPGAVPEDQPAPESPTFPPLTE